MAEKRWTIEVCPGCGAQPNGPPTECRYCEVDGGRLTTVEVIPANSPNVLSREEARLLRRFHLNDGPLEDEEDYDDGLRVLLLRISDYAEGRGE